MSISLSLVKKILGRFFLFVGIVTTLGTALLAMGFWHYAAKQAPEIKEPDVVVLDLDLTRPVSESASALPFALEDFLQPPDRQSFLLLLRALERAKDDPHVKGIIARFGEEAPTLAQIQELRAALADVRAQGKFAYAFGSDFGPFGRSSRAYYLATSFEKLWLQPVGTVGFSGLGVETPFGKNALGKLGIKGAFLQREAYKSAMEPFTRDSFSPAAKENLTAILRAYTDQIAQGIAQSRGLSEKDARNLMARGPYTGSEALQKGLIFAQGYEEDMLKAVEEKAGKDYVRTEPDAYLMYPQAKADPTAAIALINAQGLITASPLRGPARMADEEQVDAAEIATAFSDAAKDPEIKAILFRVNSPGGSPEASETIRHALVEAQKKKPVFVSMGDVAASGGYWISMDAKRIFANPGTLTGSIGVVGGKFVAGELFQKLGITWDTIKLEDNNSGLWSLRTDFSPSEKERANALMDETYRIFKDNVAAARHLSPEKVESLAKGRVYTGDAARALGLVDEIGGFYPTLIALKKEINLEPTDLVWLRPFPAPESPASLLLKFLKTMGMELAGLQQTLAPLRELRGVIAPVLRAQSAGPLSATMPDVFHDMAP